MAKAAAAGNARFGDLRQRVLSGAGLAALALGLLWLGGWWAAVLVAALAGAMAWEWRAMVRTPEPLASWEVLAPVLVFGAGVLLSQTHGFLAGLALLGAGLGALALIDLQAERRTTALWTLAGGAYLGVACLAFLALRGFEPFGFDAALWVVLVVVAADIGGYFAGRLIGGAKLWPAVSPKKTWAGLAGAVALACLLGGLFSWATVGTYYQQVCLVSGLAALLAQAGDLAESAAKRHFGLKDSSALIPGHGGVLDRCDGLVAATLAVAAATAWRGQSVFIW
ncbi:MAG: phosphatidate cytidylyltransferase [Pseudomonadota bacterium]